MDSGYGIFVADDDDDYKRRLVGDPKDTVFQIIISIILGSTAFIAFCILRPRWPGLYAARKRQNNVADSLPELPSTMLGWLPVLWSITEEQVLASAGLDAFVFLAFFKMAMKYLLVALFFALAVIKPVHDTYADEEPSTHRNKTHEDTTSTINRRSGFVAILDNPSWHPDYSADYLWMYLVFAYFFTWLALYLVTSESRRIIAIRQEYLGSQSTITDRTLRLSGIPPDLQSEEKIKEFIEDLEIGKVETVVICKNWKSLDLAMDERMVILRKLERAMTEYMGRQREERSLETLPTSSRSPREGDAEDGTLLEDSDGTSQSAVKNSRPTVRIWYGRFNLQHKTLDAIDYYEEKLRRIDEEIVDLRQKEDFPTRSLAFVTMDSVASCQMTVQAVLDSSPLQLIANLSPAPVDVVWPNTYMPHSERLFRGWSITALISLLTLFWSVSLVPIAGLIDLDRIHSVWPQLADLLQSHEFAKSLVQTQLPTLIISLLNIVVPYFYAWLSYRQGIISEGEIELSIVSKNFFFTFFNFFVVFTALGTASMSLENFGSEPLRKTANELAKSLQDLRNFYVNYIILQGLGFFPLRLLEFGVVSLYPFGLISAKTPRDHAELVQPPIFSYGFFLPQTILIFLICIVYSVLRDSWLVLLPGLGYFAIGYLVYKYQLLYAMNHQQHSTGKSWVIIVDRIIVGLIIFQFTVAGQLALRGAVKRSVGIVPLVVMTLWYSYVFNRSYKPLMTYIALRAIRRAEHVADALDGRLPNNHREAYETRSVRTDDDAREYGMKYINPSLVTPLGPPWLSNRPRHSPSTTANTPRSGSP